MIAEEFINYEAEFDLNNPYQPSNEELMEMFNPDSFVEEEDDTETLASEPIAPVCYKDVHSSLNAIVKIIQGCQSTHVVLEIVLPILPMELFRIFQCDMIAVAHLSKQNVRNTMGTRGILE
jgi:hypothetical protein